MPIISKRRFYTHLLHTLSRRQTELSLLAIWMKLYCTAPPEASDGRTELYRIAKQFQFEVETAGLMSIHVLQREWSLHCMSSARPSIPLRT
jgi:hypothetical protein